MKDLRAFALIYQIYQTKPKQSFFSWGNWDCTAVVDCWLAYNVSLGPAQNMSL